MRSPRALFSVDDKTFHPPSQHGFWIRNGSIWLLGLTKMEQRWNILGCVPDAAKDGMQRGGGGGRPW